MGEDEKICWWVNGGYISQAPIANLKNKHFYATEEECRAAAIKKVILRMGEIEGSLTCCRDQLERLLNSEDKYGRVINTFGKEKESGVPE